MKPLRIVFFGDSICCGEGVAIHNGWVTKLSVFFSDNEYGVPVVVSNASVNGDTTRTALLRMGYHVMNKGFDIMVVQFGMNDCNRWASERDCNRVSVRSFHSNLHEIIHRGFASGIKKIFLLTNHTSTLALYSDELRDYNATVRQVVSETPDEVELIDIEQFLEEPLSYLSKDGIHLTEAGNTQYSEIVIPIMRRAVEDLIKCR